MIAGRHQMAVTLEGEILVVENLGGECGVRRRQYFDDRVRLAPVDSSSSAACSCSTPARGLAFAASSTSIAPPSERRVEEIDPERWS